MKVRGKTDTKEITMKGDSSAGIPAAHLVIRRASGGDHVNRRNLFAKVRWREGGTVSEQELPMGTLMVKTIMLVLDSWDLTDPETKQTLRLSEENLLDNLEGAEIESVYRDVLDFNPMWKGASSEEDEEKNALSSD